MEAKMSHNSQEHGEKSNTHDEDEYTRGISARNNVISSAVTTSALSNNLVSDKGLNLGANKNYKTSVI